MGAFVHMLPGQRYRDHTIVASVIFCDIDCRDEWTLLLLGPAEPYFTVAIYDRVADKEVHRETSHNIVPAVREYEDCGGDY